MNKANTEYNYWLTKFYK